MADLDHSEVRGARENNLRDVSVDIPKRAITVFTGVSGSGKSSLVFGTIAAKSQRLINETYTTFLQSLMPNVGRPDVDRLRNLSAAILVDQERMGANSRSTVGASSRRPSCGSSTAASVSRTSAIRACSPSTTRKACALDAKGWAASRRSTLTRWSIEACR